MDFLKFKPLSSEGRVRPFYHLTGTEGYHVRTALDRIEEAVRKNVSASAERENYSAKDRWAEAISSFCTVPLFGDVKIVVVTDLEALAKTASTADKVLAALTSLVKSPPDNAFLVLCSSEMDGRTKLAKFLSKELCEVNCSPLKPYQFEQWVAERVQKANLNLSPKALDSLVVRTNGSMEGILNEIEKLALFATPGKPISESELERLVADSAEEPIYLLYDALDSADRERSFRMLKDVLSHLDSPLQVVFGLSKHIRMLLGLLALLDQGKRDDEIRSSLGLSSFQIGNLRDKIPNLKRLPLRRMLQLLELADERIKTSSQSGEELLYQLVGCLST
ncbi:MAG TPA: DNA polymerase III subunit delta [bacterium]|nr:DNA polymerase III subunit delta [bacterium]